MGKTKPPRVYKAYSYCTNCFLQQVFVTHSLDKTCKCKNRNIIRTSDENEIIKKRLNDLRGQKLKRILNG